MRVACGGKREVGEESVERFQDQGGEENTLTSVFYRFWNQMLMDWTDDESPGTQIFKIGTARGFGNKYIRELLYLENLHKYSNVVGSL